MSQQEYYKMVERLAEIKKVSIRVAALIIQAALVNFEENNRQVLAYTVMIGKKNDNS